MSIDQEPDLMDEDEYDEEADSDFNAGGVNDEDISTSSDDEVGEPDQQGPRKKQKIAAQHTAPSDEVSELDSGDEATIREQRKLRKKQKKKGEHVEDASDDEDNGWRARTRAMREREKEEKKVNRLANVKGSTIDVEKMWEEMNRPGLPPPLPPVQMEDTETVNHVAQENINTEVENTEKNIPSLSSEDTITIKRKFKFAGEIHTEEKVVPKSSAEARLWMAQQESKADSNEKGAALVQRPLRKVSRFDPNYNNLAAFKVTWTRTGEDEMSFKGPKLNVVEKSKLDWASHVDAEGLKDELDVHARAKEGYHNRMEFLGQVEQRREEEARQARLKG